MVATWLAVSVLAVSLDTHCCQLQIVFTVTICAVSTLCVKQRIGVPVHDMNHNFCLLLQLVDYFKLVNQSNSKKIVDSSTENFRGIQKNKILCLYVIN